MDATNVVIACGIGMFVAARVLPKGIALVPLITLTVVGFAAATSLIV